MNNQILHIGIDISKVTLEVAIATDELIWNIGGFENTQEGIEKLIKNIQSLQSEKKAEGAHFVMESTGKYGRLLAQTILERTAFQVSIVNPAQIAYFSKSALSRTKTDRVDAKIIAQYARIMQPQPIKPEDSERRELTELVRHRRHLIRKRGQEIAYLQGVTDPQIKASVIPIIEAFSAQIKTIEATIEQFLEKNSSLKKNLDLLVSIPGVGQGLAFAILTEIHPEDHTGTYSKSAQSAHAGLAPSKKESGTFRGQEKISKVGNKELRDALYMPALSAMRCNPFVQEFAARLKVKGKHNKVVLIACMRKLLMISIGVLNNQAPFNPNWVSKPKAV